jgi:PAS domain-containing protein
MLIKVSCDWHHISRDADTSSNGSTVTGCATEQTCGTGLLFFPPLGKQLPHQTTEGSACAYQKPAMKVVGFESSWGSTAASCQAIMNVVPAAAYTCDAAGQITYFNSFAETIWGRAPKLRDSGERFCGSHRLYLSDGAPIRHDECWMALTLQEGTAYLGREIVIERHDGSRSVGEAYAHPLRNKQGANRGGGQLGG